MEKLNQAYRLIDENRENIIETLRDLVKIPSVAGDAEGDMPFGREVHNAYIYMMSKAQNEGFEIFDADNYGGHIEMPGYKTDEEGQIVAGADETMGVVGHLDVVPAGKDWDFEPFSAAVSDGKIYGRGTTDDKGPVVAAYWAMTALKRAEFVPEKNCRLILGLDEETNWYGMGYYLEKCGMPDFGFTPDGEFPAIQGEKGIIVFDIARKFGKGSKKGLQLRSIKGGNAANMVADYARAVVLSDNKDDYDKVKEAAETLRKEKKYKLNIKGIGKSLEIVAHGISAHGARPAAGLNAISVLMDVLGNLSFANDDVNDFIEFYNSKIGFELDGESMGCGFEDEESGKLIFNVGVIELSTRSVTLTVNIRYPVTFEDSEIYAGMDEVLSQYNLGIIKGKTQLPIYLPKDSRLIKTLMKVYAEHTGDADSHPQVIGGGTYARAVKNTVAFGPGLPGEPDLAHQKNEFIAEDRLIMLTKLYAQAICELTMGSDEND